MKMTEQKYYVRFLVLIMLFCLMKTVLVNLLDEIKPDVYTKGADYTMETLPEADIMKKNGTRVEFISFVEGKSTTNIIKKKINKENNNEIIYSRRNYTNVGGMLTKVQKVLKLQILHLRLIE